MTQYPALHMYIDGEKVSGGGRQTFDVVNPVTGETLAELPLANSADLDPMRHLAITGIETARWMPRSVASQRGVTPLPPRGRGSCTARRR